MSMIHFQLPQSALRRERRAVSCEIADGPTREALLEASNKPTIRLAHMKAASCGSFHFTAADVALEPKFADISCSEVTVPICRVDCAYCVSGSYTDAVEGEASLLFSCDETVVTPVNEAAYFVNWARSVCDECSDIDEVDILSSTDADLSSIGLVENPDDPDLEEVAFLTYLQGGWEEECQQYETHCDPEWDNWPYTGIHHSFLFTWRSANLSGVDISGDLPPVWDMYAHKVEADPLRWWLDNLSIRTRPWCMSREQAIVFCGYEPAPMPFTLIEWEEYYLRSLADPTLAAVERADQEKELAEIRRKIAERARWEKIFEAEFAEKRARRDGQGSVARVSDHGRFQSSSARGTAAVVAPTPGKSAIDDQPVMSSLPVVLPTIKEQAHESTRRSSINFPEATPSRRPKKKIGFFKRLFCCGKLPN